MKKINLKGISEVLSEKELKNVMGGSSGSDCNSPTKVEACKGKEDGTHCTFKYSCRTYSGKCRAYYPTYKMHCSDLN